MTTYWVVVDQNLHTGWGTLEQAKEDATGILISPPRPRSVLIVKEVATRENTTTVKMGGWKDAKD